MHFVDCQTPSTRDVIGRFLVLELMRVMWLKVMSSV